MSAKDLNVTDGEPHLNLDLSLDLSLSQFNIPIRRPSARFARA
jgi:hypothetical protein